MTYDTITVMRDGFQPAELDQIVEGLEPDGHLCALFEGLSEIGAALSNPRTGLLLVASDTTDTTSLIEAKKSHSGEGDVPLLVYFSGIRQISVGDVVRPEIDDFLLAPLSVADLSLRVNRLLGHFRRRQDDVAETRQKLLSQSCAEEFIGNAPCFLAAVKKIPDIASCDATALLVGATGTGKELCARAIHYLSSRANKPFVPLNCGSVPPDLFENEIFGHESGAFTDARHAHRGLISEAEGGTLFLDEVDSLHLSAQVKLLRFLQDRQYRPLGGPYRRVNIRVIAATNHNLQALMQSGGFREDLFYRLKVVSLHLPSLYERREDVVPLALHFLKMSAREYNRPARELSAGAIQKLTSYNWPGNVRELENVIRQAVVLARGPVLRARNLELTCQAPPPQSFTKSLKASKARLIEEFERTYLEEALFACAGNITKAALHAGKDRRAFFALLKKYDLAPKPSAA